jgi:hypothetical protein
MNETEVVEVADNQNATDAKTGNLSQEDLLNFLSEESQDDASEPTEQLGGDQATSEDVLSQSNEQTESDVEISEESAIAQSKSEEEEDSDDEELDQDDEGQPKSVKKLLKQIGRLTARSKSAEEAVQALSAQVESMKLDQKVVENPTIENAQTIEQLEQLRQEALSAKKWARQHEDEDYVEDGDRQYTRAEIKGILRSAEEHLDELIPARKEFLTKKYQSDELAKRDFSFMRDTESDEYKLLGRMLKDPSLKPLDKLPNGLYLRGLMIEGVNSLKSKASTKKPAKKIAVKRPTPPPPTSPNSDVSPPARNQSSSSDIRKKFLGEGNITQDQLSAFLSNS